MIPRLIIGLVLLIHGFVHLQVWIRGMPTAGRHNARHSWLLGDARAIFGALAIAAAVPLMASGAGYALDQSWWAYAAIAGGGISLLLMVLVFNRWLLLGIALSAAAIGLALRDLAG